MRSRGVRFSPATASRDAPIVYGFFERGGGASYPPFESLNVHSSSRDRQRYVEANRALAAEALDLAPDRLVFLNGLRHGSKVYDASPQDAGKEIDGYDIIATRKSDLPVGISAADCPIVVLVDKQTPAVALVHCGWRGLRAGVVRTAVTYLRENYESDPGRIQAVVGPGACLRCYEFGREASELFDSRFVHKRKQKLYLDLDGIIGNQLKQSGVSRIEEIPGCTIEEHDRYFSHRRDGVPTGRNGVLAAIVT